MGDRWGSCKALVLGGFAALVFATVGCDKIEKCLEKDTQEKVEKCFDRFGSPEQVSPRASDAKDSEATARTKAPKEDKAEDQADSRASTRESEPSGSEIVVSESNTTTGSSQDGDSVSDVADRSRDSDDASDEPREPREPKEPKGTRSR